MNEKAIGKIAIALIAVLLIVAGSVGLYLSTSFKGGAPGTTPPGTTPPPTSGPYVSNVEIDRYLYEDEGLYMRLKVSGEADLRERVTINGVYGWWVGRVTVTLPDGSQGQLFDPEDHTTFFTQFLQISGTMIVDVCLPWEWYEERCLEGPYNVTVWLTGPYENCTVLFEKIFNLKMALTATVSPTTWRSWEENVTVTVTNTGDLPLILQGLGMEISGTGTVIGWIYRQSYEPVVIMNGETKQWIGTPAMAGDFKEELSGKTLQVDFVLDVAGAPRRFSATANVSFP